MEMPVPYCIYSEISEETTVWKDKGRCTRNHQHIMQVQGCGNHSRSSVRRSHTPKRSYTAEDKYIQFHGISEGKEHADDI